MTPTTKAEPADRRLALVLTTQKQIAPRVRNGMLRLLDEVKREAAAAERERLRLRVWAEPFFPDADGPRHGNAGAFRAYQRRIDAILAEPSDG